MHLIDSLIPLLRILQFASLSPFSVTTTTTKSNGDERRGTIKLSRFFQLYSILSMLMASTVFLHSLFDRGYYVVNVNDELGATVDFIQLFGVRMAHIIILIESFWERDKQMDILEKITQIDDVFIEKLGIKVDYIQLKKIVWSFVIGMLVIYCGLQIIFVSLCIRSENDRLYILWIAYIIPFLVSSLRYLQTVVTVYLLKSRFKLLNAKLLTIHRISIEMDENRKSSANTNKFIGNVDDIVIRDRNSGGAYGGDDDADDYYRRRNKKTTATSIIKNYKLTTTISHSDKQLQFKVSQLSDYELLITIRDVYDRLWELSNLVNNCYGVSMLINIANDFISITSNFYFIFVSYATVMAAHGPASNGVGIFGIVWSIPHIISVVAIAGICHGTVQIANETALIVHKIDYDLVNDNNNLYIEHVSLQLLHQKITFTAFGFFNVDYTLIFTMIGATTTYLVILIQFHMSSQI